MVYRKRRSRLDRFLKEEGIGPSEFARMSGYSRQHVYLVRIGEKQPSTRFISAALHAAHVIKRKRYRADQIFEFRPAERKAS
jgi:hypothetical protein